MPQNTKRIQLEQHLKNDNSERKKNTNSKCRWEEKKSLAVQEKKGNDRTQPNYQFESSAFVNLPSTELNWTGKLKRESVRRCMSTRNSETGSVWGCDACMCDGVWMRHTNGTCMIESAHRHRHRHWLFGWTPACVNVCWIYRNRMQRKTQTTRELEQLIAGLCVSRFSIQ